MMVENPEIGKHYYWQSGASSVEVVVKGQPLPLMESLRWVTPGEPQGYPGMAMQCEVIILPREASAFAKLKEFFEIEDPKDADAS